MFTLHDKARDVMQCVHLGAHNRTEGRRGRRVFVSVMYCGSWAGRRACSRRSVGGARRGRLIACRSNATYYQFYMTIARSPWPFSAGASGWLWRSFSGCNRVILLTLTINCCEEACKDDIHDPAGLPESQGESREKPTAVLGTLSG